MSESLTAAALILKSAVALALDPIKQLMVFSSAGEILRKAPVQTNVLGPAKKELVFDLTEADAPMVITELALASTGGNLLAADPQKFIGWTKGAGTPTVTLTQNQAVPEWGATDATLIAITGGTDVLKYYYALNALAANQPRRFGMFLKNTGAKTVRVSTNHAGVYQDVPADATAFIRLHAAGDGATISQFRFEALAAGDALTFVAWHPSIDDGMEIASGAVNIDKKTAPKSLQVRWIVEVA